MKMNMKTINALSAAAILSSRGLVDGFEKGCAAFHVYTNGNADDEESYCTPVMTMRTYH